MGLVMVYLQQDQDEVKPSIPKIVEFGKISFLLSVTIHAAKRTKMLD